jgi:hypothetical protein
MIFFFLTLAALTVTALAWTGYELFSNREDPLAARLEELQAQAISTGVRRPVRRRGGFLNGVLNAIGLSPGVSNGYETRKRNWRRRECGKNGRWALMHRFN